MINTSTTTQPAQLGADDRPRCEARYRHRCSDGSLVEQRCERTAVERVTLLCNDPGCTEPAEVVYLCHHCGDEYARHYPKITRESL